MIKNVLFKLEQKKLNKFLENPKALAKFNLAKAFNDKLEFNYLNYFYVSRWITWLILKEIKIFGVGVPTYYSFSSSKWQKLVSKNPYQLKLSLKKDSWFFFWYCNFKKNLISKFNINIEKCFL